MPVIFDKLEQVPPEQAPPDFSQISGFYGPGAWAAWVITMAASWISLIQGDNTHSLHFLGYALYTNWAAIDFLRHVSRVPGYNDDFSAVEQARSKNIVASVAVLNVGIFQAVGQMLVYVFVVAPKSTPGRCSSVARGMYLIVGVILPLGMLCYGLTSYIFFSDSIGRSLQTLLLVVIDGVAVLIAGVASYALYNVSSPILILYHHPLLNFYQHPLFNCFTHGLILLTSLTLIMLSVSFMDRGPVVFGVTRTAARCYFVPCAPQKIGEWDQAFSLLVAFVLFLYEFGSGMIRAMEKGIQALYRTWLPAAW